MVPQRMCDEETVLVVDTHTRQLQRHSLPPQSVTPPPSPLCMPLCMQGVWARVSLSHAPHCPPPPLLQRLLSLLHLLQRLLLRVRRVRRGGEGEGLAQGTHD
jgi:hypothetical protein